MTNVEKDYTDHLRAEVDRLEKELEIADERRKRAEAHHEVHESDTKICTAPTQTANKTTQVKDSIKDNPQAIIEWAEGEIKAYQKLITLIKKKKKLCPSCGEPMYSVCEDAEGVENECYLRCKCGFEEVN